MSSFEAGLVSVILATYNRPERLPRAVRSVLAQTYALLELIVVVDGVSESTTAALARVSDARLRVVILPVNGGIERARNAGLERARGEFVAFIDDDDVWLPNKLARQVRQLVRDSDLGLVHAAVTDFFADGRRLKRRPPRGANTYRANLIRDCLATSSVVVRHSVFERLGAFDPQVGPYADWEMWLRILRAYACASIGEPLALTEQWAGSVTHGDAGVLARSRALVLRRRWRDLRAHGLGRAALAFNEAFVAGLLLVRGRRREARRRALRSLRLKPSLRGFLVLVLSFGRQSQVDQGWRQLQRLRRALRA